MYGQVHKSPSIYWSRMVTHLSIFVAQHVPVVLELELSPLPELQKEHSCKCVCVCVCVCEKREEEGREGGT